MSIEENKKIALSLIEALNARDLSLWSRHLSEDYAAEHPSSKIPLELLASGYWYEDFERFLRRSLG